METILFYTPGTCSMAGIIALHRLAEPFQLCRVEKEERSTPAYLRINPRGQVPALRVDGRFLAEVNAILAHIANRRPELELLPREGTWERDIANQWMSYFASSFHSAFWPYFNAHRYVNDIALHDAVREAAIDAIKRELKTVNALLEGKEFVLDAYSLLDGYLHAMDRWANKLVDMPSDYPNIWRHQKMMARDPSVRFASAIEHADGDALRSLPEATGFMLHVSLANLDS
jgi:glutathione S-transferase